MPTEKAHGGQIMKMCEAWGKKHQVVLWSPWRINYIKKNPFDFYGVEKNFKIKKIFSLDFLPMQWLFGRAAFYFQNISFAIFVSLRLAFSQADLFFSRDFWSSFFLSLFGKKVVYEIHDSPNQHQITRFAFKKIYKFITTNAFKKQELINSFGINEGKILVATNRVDFDFFNIKENKAEARKILNLPEDKKIVLYTGHLYSWKGAETLGKAARKMSRDVLTVFVGGTREDEKKFREDFGNDDATLILGHQEYKKIPYFLRASDVLVLPNTARERISLRETSPLKLFEYMASGKPVIASDLPSIREVVSEKEVVFFEPDNPDDLSNKIEEVLSNYEKYSGSVRDTETFAKWFSWDNRAENILKFVEN